MPPGTASQREDAWERRPSNALDCATQAVLSDQLRKGSGCRWPPKPQGHSGCQHNLYTGPYRCRPGAVHVQPWEPTVPFNNTVDSKPLGSVSLELVCRQNSKDSRTC